MTLNFKCNFSLFLILSIAFSYCGNRVEIIQKETTPVDSTKLINKFLEEDSQKHIEIKKLVYELGNGESYIKGELIKRVLPDTILTNKTITLKAHSTDPYSLLSKIQIGEIAITVNEGAMKGARKVSFNVVKKPLALFLTEDFCKNQPFDYRVDGTLLVFFRRIEDTIKLKTNDSINYYIEAPKATQLHLKLSDRTNIWINAGTVISFSGNLVQSRNLRMTGEGCFDVTESKDTLCIKTAGNHKFILRRGILNINTFDLVSHTPNSNYLPATDQEMNKLATDGKLKDINCNPCSLDSLIDIWNHKEHHSVVADISRIHDSAEPVYVNMSQASFSDIITNVIQKQSKLGGYIDLPGRIFIITGTEHRIMPANFSANLKNGDVKVYCGNCQQRLNLKGNECLTFEKYDLLTMKPCDPSNSMSWTKGYFEPSQQKSFYESLKRWYDIEVTSSNSSMSNKLEGHIPIQASLKDILELFKLNQIQYKLMLTGNGETLNIVFD